jgi:hypothetical protein
MFFLCWVPNYVMFVIVGAFFVKPRRISYSKFFSKAEKTPTRVPAPQRACCAVNLKPVISV